MIRAWVPVSALLSVLAAPAGAAVLVTSDGQRLAVVESIANWPEAPLLVATSADGLTAAVLLPEPPHGHQVVLVESGRQPRPALAAEGRILDLLFVGDPPELFALEHRPAKHRVGQTTLLRLDPRKGRFRRVLSLAPSARKLVYWPAEHAVLIPSKDALRTISLPGLTSGPIFRVIGDNLSACAVGGSRFLVGQADRVIELDLADRPGQEEMPRRDELRIGGPVRRLAPAIDGSSVWARLGERGLYPISRAPLRLDGPGIEGLLVYREVDPTRVTAGSGLPAPADPPPQPEAPAAVATPVPPVAAPRPASETTSVPQAFPDAPTRTDKNRSPPQLHGRLTGPAAAQVAFVVLRGPDNLLREAARLRPDSQGRFFADNLASGRYKVEVDAGASRVLVTRPPFVMVELPNEGSIQLPDLFVLNAR